MPTVPDDAKPSINTEFVRRLEAIDPPTVDILVETEAGLAGEIAQEITQFPQGKLGSAGAFGGKYIAAVVPQETIPDVARLDGVVQVSQDQPAGVMEAPTPSPPSNGRLNVPFLTQETDPIRTALSDALYEAVGPDDPFVPNVRIGEVEVPRFNFSQLGDPLEALVTTTDKITGSGLSGETLIPTSESVGWIRDSTLTDGAIAADTRVSIIDTGHTPTEPENGGRVPLLESMVPGEPGLDLMGHGSWCTNMVTGNPSPGVWGTTAGVAPGSIYAHFKALNTFPGFGKTSWILKAMTRSLEWGADVVSMSLGGTQQGPIDEDPYSRFIAENNKQALGDEGAIFVVAAGNAGPDKWTIGSPGVAPGALTVASWSLTDSAPAVFSSRGPQGSYYSDKPEELRQDASAVGQRRATKPDVAAPGGGRKNSDLAGQSDELLFQTSTGWYDGLKDGVKDARANMEGTSMATPAVAGLVKRLYDAGVVQTAAEIKQVVRQRGTVETFEDVASGGNETRNEKNIAIGYGPIRESLFEPGE